jgi:acyl-CoA synthetase (AMP-forming)/AMP-acid ligase II
MWVYPEIRTLGDIARTLRGAVPGATARIGYFGRNHAELAELVFGTAKAGFAFMPLNWRLAPAEIAALLEDSDCAVLFVDHDLASSIDDALARIARRPQVVVFDPAGPAWLGGFVAERLGDDAHFAVAESATALHMYTSGTTGLPKGVELAHGAFNYMRLCEHLDTAANWQPGETFLMFMPSFHLAGVGWLIQCLYNGMTVSMLPQFDPPARILRVSSSWSTQDRRCLFPSLSVRLS